MDILALFLAFSAAKRRATAAMQLSYSSSREQISATLSKPGLPSYQSCAVGAEEVRLLQIYNIDRQKRVDGHLPVKKNMMR